MPTRNVTLLRNAELVALLPAEIAAPLISMRRDVIGTAAGPQPRLTVKRFVQPVYPADVIEAVIGFGPLAVTLGPVLVSQEGRLDVVAIEVVPADVWQLNWLLGDRFGWADGAYTPRVVIGTTARGQGERFAGDMTFFRAEFTVDVLHLLSPRRAARTVQL